MAAAENRQFLLRICQFLLISQAIGDIVLTNSEMKSAERDGPLDGRGQARVTVEERCSIYTVDIRNDPNDITNALPDNYETCTILEGNFAITMTIQEDEEKQPLVYPMFKKLREITGHLLIYQTFGLKSLKEVLPELRIIRGNTLIMNYALIIYQTHEMLHIGLDKLTEISNGGVRIAENAALCGPNDIRWSMIVRGKINDTLMEDNQSECLPSGCEKSPSCVRKASDQSAVICWDGQHCQTNCTCASGCLDGHINECCHPECAGGCIGPLATQCHACRHFRHRGVCIAQCPPGMYRLRPQDRLCVSARQCLAIEPVVTPDGRAAFKATEDMCHYECPTGYKVNETDESKCVKCDNGKCPKRCGSLEIKSVGELSGLEQCEIVDGHVEISISTAQENVALLLKEKLGLVREVRDYIQVREVPGIYSLEMFANLTKIHGKHLYNNFAFVVTANENLRLLIPKVESEKTIELQINGLMQVQNNPHLCTKYIEQFIEATHSKQTIGGDDQGIGQHSNGFKEICEEKTLRLNVKNGINNFIAEWDGFVAVMTDPRKFLGYQLFWRVVPGPNSLTDIHAGADACNNVWNLESVNKPGDNSLDGNNIASLSHEIKFEGSGALITYTQYDTWYAFFVRTLMVMHSDAVGGISPVFYVKSDFGMPSKPVGLKATATAGSIHLTWKAPLKPNGRITHYTVEYKQVQEMGTGSASVCDPNYRNTLEKLRSSKNTEPASTPVPSFVETAKNSVGYCASQGCCACEKKTWTDEEMDAIEEYGMSKEEVRKKREKDSFEDTVVNHNFYRHRNTAHLYQNRRGRREAIDNGPLNEHDNKKSTISVPGADVGDDRDSYTVVGNDDEVKVQLDNVADDTTTRHSAIPSERVISALDGNFTQMEGQYNTSHTSLTIEDLPHFTEYEIIVTACQDTSISLNFCSQMKAKVTLRTLAIKHMDEINSSSISITSYSNGTDEDGLDNDRKVTWDPPADPNGAVLFYELEYWEVGRKPSKPVCVSPNELATTGALLPQMRGGTYELHIRARTRSDYGAFSTPPQTFEVEGSGLPMKWMITFSIIVPLLIVLLGSLFAWRLYQHKMKKMPQYIMNMVEMNPEYIQQMDIYKADEWELNREDIEVLQELGHGTFGKVYRGNGRDVQSQCGLLFGQCAIKCVGDTATQFDRYAFLHEASVMKNLNTAHIVKLYGVVSNGQPVYVVMELMDKGNMRDYLRSRRPGAEENVDNLEAPTLKQIYLWAGQIADGMAYLEQIKFCHRDVAARNVLVSHSLICKIGDFGMARDVYVKEYYRPMGKRLSPVRWMAPEALMLATFTPRSDVWAYGIVLWEMVTLGLQPYPGIPIEGIQEFVVDKRGTMANTSRFSPVGCPPGILEMMEMCWQFDPRHRPTFAALCQKLLPHMDELFKKISHTCTFNREPIDLSSGEAVVDHDEESDKAGQFAPPDPCNSVQQKLASIAHTINNNEQAGHHTQQGAFGGTAGYNLTTNHNNASYQHSQSGESSTDSGCFGNTSSKRLMDVSAQMGDSTDVSEPNDQTPLKSGGKMESPVCHNNRRNKAQLNNSLADHQPEPTTTHTQIDVNTDTHIGGGSLRSPLVVPVQL